MSRISFPKKRTNRRYRTLKIESLENRFLMDGNGLTDDAFEVCQNTGFQLLDVLGNDTYIGGRITSVSYGSQGGRIEIAEDQRSLSYSPPANFSGSETFTYYIDDLLSANVSISVKSPLAPDQYQFAPTGEVRILDVLANDPFWANYDGPGKITSVGETTLGSEVRIADDGKSLIYTSPISAYGKDAFVYIVDDLYPAEVKIEIPNPLKEDSFPGLVQNSGENVLDVLVNDPFWDGYSGARKITHIGTGPSHGTVTIAENGVSLVYTPSLDFSGCENFTYVVDGLYEATVSLQVHRPVQDDWYQIDVNTTGYLMPLIANDIFWYYDSDGNWISRDVVDRITSAGATSAGGSVQIADDGQGVIYSAPAGFLGTDTFEYIADGKYRATVTINITNPVREDTFWNSVFEDTVNNVLDVMQNDFIGSNYQGPKIITAVSGLSGGGVVTIAADGRSLLYTPAPGFKGLETFQYTVDGVLQADVKVYVNTIASCDSYAFYPDTFPADGILYVLGNDHFWQNYPGPGIITAVSQTSNGGTVTISPDGKSLRFTPFNGGAEHFTYTVDGKYQASVYVSFYNCLQSDSFAVDQNGTNIELNPLANDFQRWQGPDWMQRSPYAGPRLITSVSCQGGTATISADGKTLLYSPAADFVGEDQLTYTVDGLMQERITVHVIRRVRDDVFHVDGDCNTDILPVLVNDLFGANYTGAGRITAVTTTEAGGTVVISQDGKSISYIAPIGFSGKDRFTYTVDGRLKATVDLYVKSSPADVLSRFGSREALFQYLLADALKRYDSWFGKDANWRGSCECCGDIAFALNGDELRSHSDTNVQVAGVDEGDIIENDGTFLYVLSGGKMTICRAWPAEDMEVVSQTQIRGTPLAEYLHGDRLTVISQMPRTYGGCGLITSAYTFDALFSDVSMSPLNYLSCQLPLNAETIVTVFDVSDRSAPKVVEMTTMDGQYVESRRINDSVFLVLRNNRTEFCLPEPERIPITDSTSAEKRTTFDQSAMISLNGGSGYVYESREEYLQRMTNEIDRILGSMLPHFSSFGPDGQLLRTGLLDQPEDIAQIGSKDVNSLISVVSMNISDDTPGITASTGICTSGASKIYGSLDNLYVFDQIASAEDGTTTQILQFHWNGATGNIDLAAKGHVAGWMLNQFSADEFDGNLRIATTISNSCSGNWSNRSENVLFVLRNDGGVLEFVGGMQNLALGESIKSVRFLGSRVFVTTFRDIDPLFAIDLSDPTHPLSCGHIALQGYNSYLQLIDENHILAIGRNTPAGTNGPTQIALYDVQDLSRPRIIDTYTFQRFSTSEAESDHHAFGWFAEHQVLSLPVGRTRPERFDANGDGYCESTRYVQEDELLIFKIDVTADRQSGNGIQLLGGVEHDSSVHRSAFIEDVLYSVSDTSIQAVSIADPTIRFGEVDLHPMPSESPITITPLPDGKPVHAIRLDPVQPPDDSFTVFPECKPDIVQDPVGPQSPNNTTVHHEKQRDLRLLGAVMNAVYSDHAALKAMSWNQSDGDSWLLTNRRREAGLPQSAETQIAATPPDRKAGRSFRWFSDALTQE